MTSLATATIVAILKLWPLMAVSVPKELTFLTKVLQCESVVRVCDSECEMGAISMKLDLCHGLLLISSLILAMLAECLESLRILQGPGRRCGRCMQPR